MQSRYDVCIIGAGIAGALVAAACTRKGKTVLIIEAGGRFDRAKRFEQLERYLAAGPAWKWDHSGRDSYTDTTPAFRYDLNSTRVKAVGGSTLHWGGTSQRLHPTDFETLTRYGVGADWPISYKEIEPYYVRAERELGVSGDSSAHAALRSAGYPMPEFPDSFSDGVWRRAAARIGASVEKVPYAKNSKPYAGRPACAAFSTCHVCPIGAQYSADVHIAEAEASGRCTVMTRTVARRIETDSRGRARAVHATDLDMKEHSIVADHFVIAAHAVESARLLLLSDVGVSSGHVGRWLMEHFYVRGEARVPERFYPGRIGFETLQCASFYDGDERRERGGIKLELGHGMDPLVAPQSQKLWGKRLAEFDDRNFSHLVGVSAETEHLPHWESRVALDPTVKDGFGDPVPRIHFHLGAFEAGTRARAVQVIARLLEAANGSDIVTDATPNWAAHHLGTCRMAADPDKGVVDRNLKVFGTTNLYAAGSGAFPTGGALQPTLTIAALALRLADTLTGLKAVD